MYHLAAVFCFNFSHYIRTTRKKETLKGLKQKALQHFKPSLSLTRTYNLISLRAQRLEVIKYTAIRKQSYLVVLTQAEVQPHSRHSKKQWWWTAGCFAMSLISTGLQSIRHWSAMAAAPQPTLCPALPAGSGGSHQKGLGRKPPSMADGVKQLSGCSGYKGDSAVLKRLEREKS